MAVMNVSTKSTFVRPTLRALKGQLKPALGNALCMDDENPFGPEGAEALCRHYRACPNCGMASSQGVALACLVSPRWGFPNHNAFADGRKS